MYEHRDLGQDAQIRTCSHSDGHVGCTIGNEKHRGPQLRLRKVVDADTRVVEHVEMIDEILPAGPELRCI